MRAPPEITAVAMAPGVAALVCIAGCFDAVQPDTIFCGADSECPAPLVCAVAQHVCVDAGADVGAPFVSDAHFEPAALNGGSSTLVVTASEALDPTTAPIVELAASQSGELALGFAGSD